MPTPIQNKAYKEAVLAASQAGAKFPELVAAQYALESAYGTKMSGANNPFGQKARASEVGSTVTTQEFTGGKMAKTTAKFKDYASLTEAFEEHVQRWDGELEEAKTLEDAANALVTAGYATDPEYAKKLISVMRSNGVDPKSAGGTLDTEERPIKPAGSPSVPVFNLNWSPGSICGR